MHELELMLKRLRELRIPPLSRMGADRIYRRYGVTEEEFFDLSTEDDKWELLDGTLIIHSPASIRHERPAQFLSWLLAAYVDEKDLGEVFKNPMVIQFLLAKRNLFAGGASRTGMPEDI